MKKLYLIVLLFVGVATGATAQTREEIDQTMEKADKGDAESQFLMGYYAFSGKRYPLWDNLKPENRKKGAFKCFKSAAAQGQIDAILYLGYCYLAGYGVEQNNQEAIKYLKQIEGKEDKLRPTSQYMLAQLSDVFKDYILAAKMYKAAAKTGHPGAMCKLGECYLKGKGVEQNYTEAVKLFKYATDKGVAEAKCFLALCYMDGSGVEQDVNEAKKLVEEAASAGDPKAEFIMGDAYRIGGFVEKNLNKAIDYYKKAAEKGQADALFQLGQCYYKGEGVEFDITKAKELYIEAAKRGNEEAQAELKKRFNMDVNAK